MDDLNRSSRLRIVPRNVPVRIGWGEVAVTSHFAICCIQPNFVAATLTEAADWILEQTK